MNEQENIYYLINSYFELKTTPDEDKAIFEQLVVNEDAKKYFKELQLIKIAVKTTMVDPPDSMNEKILKNVLHYEKTEKTNIVLFNPTFFRWVAIFFIAVTVYLSSVIFSYRQNVENVMQQVNEQKKTIELLMNSLPVIKVSPTIEKTIN